MQDERPVRELNWWEHYPLHKVWCNDYCPLVPRFEYRKGDEWNANNWNFHWLIFQLWTMEHFVFGIDVEIQPDSAYIGAMLPYLRIVIGFRHVLTSWQMKLNRMLRRKPLLKNHKGEYNL